MPPPLSAVAARRAAREAAQAAASASASAAPPPAKKTPAKRPSPPAPAARVSVADEASSSADEAPPPAKVARASGNGQANGKGAQKTNGQKGKAPAARYFAPPEQREEDVMLLDVDGESSSASEGDDEEGEGESPPEGLDEEEEEALMSRDAAMEVEVESEGVRTPRSGGRRRREKSAFTDPYCVSAFQVVPGVSAARTVVKTSNAKGGEGGCDAVVYALREGESLIIHGTFLLAPLFGRVTSLGAVLRASPPASSSSIALPTLPPPSDLDAPSSPFHRFFAPSSHPLAPISALPLPPSSSSTPTSPTLTLGDNTTLDLSRFAAAVLVLDLPSSSGSGIEGIERPLVVGGMGAAGGMWPKAGKQGLEGGRTWKLITSPTPSLTSLRPLPAWDSALAAALPAAAVEGGASSDPGRFVALVEGPKRVGKSTVARMAVNALLDRYESVAYLDTDLGQPELTAPGFLSLHILRRPLFGPSFTHLALPLSSHYLGSLSPASDPAGYVAAAQALLETYALEVEYPLVEEERERGFGLAARRRGRNRFAREEDEDEGEAEDKARAHRKIRERVPLVVNTQGWVKGLGADLLAKLKALAQPTCVFSFASATGEDALLDPYAAGGPEQQQPYHLFTLPPAPPSPLESKYSAADYRTLSLVSYFHTLYSATCASPLPIGWDFTRSLVATAPLPVSWRADDARLQSVHLIAPGAADGEIAYEHVLHALNGAVVAVVASSAAAEERTPRPFPYDPSLPAPSPSSSRALGLALVHSISPSTQTLHLLTPLPPAALAAAAPLTLVSSALDLPLPLMLDYSVSVSDAQREEGVVGVSWADEGEVPFLTKGEEEKGAVGGKRRVRRNLMRRGQA
ncbi:hypothetical protein JCM10213_005358 [Rhodosporidiobolus nylandii]